MHQPALRSVPPPCHFIDFPSAHGEVLVEVVFRAGFRTAPPGKEEVPHLLEHLILRHLLEAGFDCSAATNVRHLTVSATFPAGNRTDRVVEFLRAVFTVPAATPSRLRKERNIMLNEVTGMLHEPSTLGQRCAVNAAAAGPGPYALVTAGIDSLTVTDLSDHYRQFCTADRAMLFIGAAETDKKLRAAVEEFLASFSWPIPLPPQTASAEVTLAPATTICHPLSSGRVHAALSWGLSREAHAPAQQISLLLALDLLTAHRSGLLWRVLQEEAGLTYAVEGHVDYYGDYGFFSLHSDLLPADLPAGLDRMEEQVGNVLSGTYSQRLFKALLEETVADLEERWADPAGRFYWLESDLLDRKRPYPLSEWQAIYRDINRAAVSAAAQAHLSTEHRHTILVGEISALPG
jgi:predicted Zn-dependent peptidase